MDLLMRCFKGTRETPPRLMRVKPDMMRAEDHLRKAEHNIRAMDKMLESKFFDWTIICGYYAMYHAVMGSLWLIGLEARSHECAISAFERFYVKKGRVGNEYMSYMEKAKQLSKKYADSLENAKDKRVKASYGIGEVKSPEAERIKSDAKAFVRAISNLVHEAKGITVHEV